MCLSIRTIVKNSTPFLAREPIEIQLPLPPHHILCSEPIRRVPPVVSSFGPMDVLWVKGYCRGWSTWFGHKVRKSDQTERFISEADTNPLLHTTMKWDVYLQCLKICDIELVSCKIADLTSLYTRFHHLTWLNLTWLTLALVYLDIFPEM